MKKSDLQPFSSFGLALKNLRTKHNKTCAEVSGAVEIDEQKLLEFEEGRHRPTEDVLLLIIQHFDLIDDDAKDLWRLAGYSESFDDSKYFINDDTSDIHNSKTVMITPHDARIVYTDMIQVMVNNFGVIINFMQGAGAGTSPLAVSRVGMSKEHAKSVIDVLTKTLQQAEETDKKTTPKQLPANTQNQE
jgi:transcriptional regulator with XRE-family HTH domain